MKMEKRLLISPQDQSLPVPVQLFLWRQLKPFIRPRLGRLHEASCPDMKEACNCLERVLVQNLHNELTPSLRTILESVPRWRLIQASFPFVIHATANVLNNRKDTQNIGAMETTLLYILHWIILDSADECADEDNTHHENPFYYLFPINTITLFVFVFAPLCHLLRDIDFKSHLRLENGQLIWKLLCEYRHPEAPCFTALCLPKSRVPWKSTKSSKQIKLNDDIFVGSSKDAPVTRISEKSPSPLPKLPDTIPDSARVSSPKDATFPETIPEESSSTEDEHVVIFTLPSLDESERVVDEVKEVSTIFAGEASIFHVAMGRSYSSAQPTLTIEQVMPPPDSDTETIYTKGTTEASGTTHSSSDSAVQGTAPSTEKEPVKGIRTKTLQRQQRAPEIPSSPEFTRSSTVEGDTRAATFLDVAVLECLLDAQWQEEGVYWGLQFLTNRLRRINDEPAERAVPTFRRRCNSLPNPKMESSLYRSTESKIKGDSKDVAPTPEPTHSQYSDRSMQGETRFADYYSENNHLRRSHERSKKLKKIKTFVETKLLSKSEKALEMFGQEEQSKSGQEEPSPEPITEVKREPVEEHVVHQTSIPTKLFYEKDPTYTEFETNLVKGKSMPSLSSFRDTPTEAKDTRTILGQSFAAPNPIITVTEHTPTPSPDYSKLQSSIDSHMDTITVQTRSADKKRGLVRSQSDTNIIYFPIEIYQAPGSVDFISKEGNMDYKVVLQAVHAVAVMNDANRALRITELVLNLVDLLIELGILKHLRSGKTDTRGNVERTGSVKTGQNSPVNGEAKAAKADNKEDDSCMVQCLMMNIMVHTVRYLGCPHGCSEGVRSPQAEFCRSQIQSVFTKLHKCNSTHFSNYMRHLMKSENIVDILDFFHAYAGFCVDPNSLLSPLNQKRGSSKSPDSVPPGCYASNFGAGMTTSNIGNSSTAIPNTSNVNQPSSSGQGGSNVGSYGVKQRFRNIESQIVSASLKAFVTRCVASTKELKTQENVGLYCDLRHFLAYVKEVHGGVFRRVALSGILDSTDRPNKRSTSNVQTTRVIRHINPSEVEENNEGGENYYTTDDRGMRKYFLKKRSTSSTCASLLETELSEENIKATQSPSGNIRKKHYVVTPRPSEKNLEVGDPRTSARKPRKFTRFQIGGIVNWLRKEYRKTESTDSHESSESPTEGSFPRQTSLQRPHVRGGPRATHGVTQTLYKAKRRMESQLNKIGLMKGKKSESFQETPGSYFSRKDSVEVGEPSRETEFVLLKERRLISGKAVFEGMSRFSFLLEICQPGAIPDHHLMAALLDLPSAPVAARAAMLLECAHLVHQCNKGHWPTWMKMNFPMFRPSMALGSRASISGLRRTHVLQRAAGKLFYQWAEAIGARLEEFLADEVRNVPFVNSIVLDESKHRDLLTDEEDEDFLDESSIKTYGVTCPKALQLVACMLLFEITSFLRETYQSLPKPSKISTKDRQPPWEKIYSREANRRWSMALSSMGHSQASAQSLQSIVGERETERKISFVLHEPDNESEGSSKSNGTLHGEEVQVNEKEKAKKIQPPQTRPFLLRRGTMGNAAGSFKRRSLKLRRGTKEGKEIECETFRRADSIQSKRKVSSLSDRSDNSETGMYGEVSGEESPGILSDDQPPESPSDSNDADETNKTFPWLKVAVQVMNQFNYICCHQHFCHPFCHRRQMRAGGKLVKSIRKIYGEEFGPIDDTGDDVDAKKKDSDKKDKQRSRKVSEQTSAQISPVRKDSVGKKYKIDKNIDTTQLGRLSSGNRGSSKDICDQESDCGRDAKAPGTALQGLEAPSSEAKSEPSAILKYLQIHVKNAFHAPIATLLKGAVVMPDDLFIAVLPTAWEMLLESDQEVAAAAASLFIVAAVRAPNQASELIDCGLKDENVAVRVNSIFRFQALWKSRYQVWPRMEEAAHVTFKVPPPGIEFTLPSPKIGIESLPVVDPPWMPQVKTKVEEVTINHERHRALVTATKTRKKQQTELIKKALQAQDDKKREERENFLITTIPITVQAACEPSPVGEDHDDGINADDDGADIVPRNTSHHGVAALSLFPSSLCSAIIQIINLLDDFSVTDDGNGVYDIAYQVIWNCLVEDSALFLRYVLERLTRDKPDMMFKILRHLIRFVPKLPQQAAFALYNYIIGYIMFYVRTPHEEGQKFIGMALSVLWMVVHSVHGIMFKDLKQILRKEQCDASILLTANVPSAKKIIVHGPQETDAGGIPSQFPVQEDTQFCQILRESLDFFGIEESKHKEFFLIDYKTHQIRNPSSYVRDFYFFKRSQYPQLELVQMKPEDAFNALQHQELDHKFIEIGKVLLTWAILKNVDMVVQRVVFLHEELMKLPSFPRKALESDLDLYKDGELGPQLLALDVMHKFMWVRLIARMFEAMAGNFAYSGDIHIFLNVLNGAIILHSQDSCILRYVVATYINAAHNFKNIFSTSGYLLIMPTLLQLYSMHQTNQLVTTTVEYAVKQFYLMNRKPFILQMFGSVSAILDTDETSAIGEAHKVPSNCLFNLLLSLETPSPDPLNIGELVKEEKPLKAIDFCYHDECEMVNVLDCISLCVMVIAYAADSIRGQQMLVILEAILPCYIQKIQQPTYNRGDRTEKEIINQLAIAVRTLINNSEALTKYYNRPQKSSPEHKGSSQRNYGKGPYSPGFDFEEDTHTSKYSEHTKRNLYDRDKEDSEYCYKYEFRRPRDTLLNIVGDFLCRCTARLVELNKKAPDGKNIELLDNKCHVRLADVAHSLLKISPYDPDTMACRGLKRYMNDVLPSAEWSNDELRPALTVILRRLDKTFSKIYKKANIRRNTNWDAASDILKGVYETLSKCPYIAHFQYFKTLLSTCQALIIGDTAQIEVTSSASAALMTKIPPQHFCSTVLRLLALQLISLGEGYTLENMIGGHAMFATNVKTENVLLNLLMPLFLRVGTGRKDVPKLRQSDICFALSAVLNALWPTGAKTMQVNAPIKTATDVRTGSITFTARESKTLTKISMTLYQVAFLALKIMIICFEPELAFEWPKILRTMRLLNKRNEASLHLWNFLEFNVTHRTPLYIQMMPFTMWKISQAPISEHERNMQTIIRDKIKSVVIQIPKSRGVLIADLMHELKVLKQEIEDKKIDESLPDPKKGAGDIHQMNEAQLRNQRPSLFIDLLTGDAASRAHAQRPSGEPSVAYVNTLPASARQSVSSSNATRTSLQSQGSGGVEGNASKPEPTMAQLSPNSPNGESSGENQPDKPRLQRSMGQSKRTFRLKKGRKNLMELPGSSQGEQADTESVQDQDSPLSITVPVPETPTTVNPPSDSSSSKSKSLSSKKDSDVPSSPGNDQIPASEQQSSSHLHHQYHHLRPRSDASWDEDTSSTSGYRESYSLQLVSLESGKGRGNRTPPLASPDLPSTSSTTTNYIAFDGSSPDCSINGSGGEKTALLTQSSQRSNSQHSLLMAFQTQDEDTLI